MGNTSKHAVDLARWREMHSFPTYSDGSEGFPTPLDMPTSVRVYRLMEDLPKHAPPAYVERALRGWTMEVDCFTFGVKVFIRIGRNGTLRVFAEDSEELVKLEEWTK